MAWHIHQFVLGLHILAAIAWAGGILFVGWGVFPTLKKFDYINQQRILKTLMETVHLWLTAFGAFVIITGMALGTVLGPVKQWDTLWHTSYGHKLLFALLLGIFALGWGAKISYPFTMRLLKNNTLWQMAQDGWPRFLKQSLLTVQAVASVEAAAFVVLLAIMLSF